MAQFKKTSDWKSTLLYSILFLFFFQLLSDFIEAIYAFGLLGTSIPIEIACVLFLFTPLLLVFRRQGLPYALLLACGFIILICRVIEPLLDTRGRMLVSGVGVGAFFIFFPSLLHRVPAASRVENTAKQGGKWAFSISLGGGLALGLALSALLRVLGSGFDLSNQGWFQAIGWLLGVFGIALLFTQTLEKGDRLSNEGHPPATFGKTLALVLGIISVWILIYFAFASPNVIARWTGAPYGLIITLFGISMAGFGLLLAFRLEWLIALPRRTMVVANIVFTLALVFTILPHQIRFPSDPSDYPFYEPTVTPLAYLPLTIMLLLAPLILLDFLHLIYELGGIRLSHRALSVAFSIGSLYLLVMIFAQVFTTVYDYIPVVGPLFRDRFWLVYLVPGIVLSSSLLFLRKSVQPMGLLSFPRSLAKGMLATLGVMVIAIPLTSAKPGPPQAKSSLRVLTYNIQQGYSEDGRKNHTGQLELIREVDADVIGLQESDTNRISGGNSDIVRYFADHLDLYSYYGPKVVPGTFGIALLSKYPIQNPRTFYMYSEGEQTATIWAQVSIGDRTFNLFVTHLGNGGPIVQQQALLKEVNNLPNVIAMGDFNFRPDAEQYRLTRTILEDAWLLKWPNGVDDQGFNPIDRIDHVFVSPGIEVTQARYLVSSASDHPAFMVEIQW